MKRRLASAALALLLAAVGARGEEPSLWFPVGEEMRYAIHWGFLHVGETQVTTSWTNHGGRTLIAIRYYTRTNRLVHKLYPVENSMESLIDPATFLPVRFTKVAREGRHRTDEVTEFDHARGEARFENRLKNKTKTLALDPDTRDVIAMMYWLRREPFVTGVRQDYRVMADEKLYDLSLLAAAEEKVKLDKYGAVECRRIEPEAAFNGLFVRKGKMTFWVSQDARRACTKMIGEVPVASIRVTLAEVKGPGDDVWVKKAAPAEGDPK